MNMETDFRGRATVLETRVDSDMVMVQQILVILMRKYMERFYMFFKGTKFNILIIMM